MDFTLFSLKISPSRSAHLGGTVATIGFPDPSLQGFSPKLAKGEIASLSGTAGSINLDPFVFAGGLVNRLHGGDARGGFHRRDQRLRFSLFLAQNHCRI
jgi:hypothetical protein